MMQPPGLVDPTHPSFHCKLDKALYGLKQAPRTWYSRLSDKLHSLGFVSSKVDISLFMYRKGQITIFLLAYIDDIIIASSSDQAIDALLLYLHSDFTLKDLDPFHSVLGVQVTPISDGLLFSQEKCMHDLLRRSGMNNCKPAVTPLSTSEKLSGQQGEPLSTEDVTKYRNIVDALQYLTLTRPDITFSINKSVPILTQSNQLPLDGSQEDHAISLAYYGH
jgi:hypothetical protein